MHNGNRYGHGPGHGNGKRWLLIGLLILGGFWLVNDSYDDGYRDALVQTGQVSEIRHERGGPDFPWGLLILGGIGYIAWRKGAFDRFGGPGGPFGPGHGNGERGMQRYGAPQTVGAPGPGFGAGFRGPRAVFEEWHRESHEAERVQPAAWAQQAQTQTPAAAPSPADQAETAGNGQTQGQVTPTPPPPPPAPDYWATMNPAPDAPANPGPAPERW